MAHGDSTVAGEHASTARIDLRAVWVQIHLWLGLTLGVLGAVLGVSGSLLVYDHAIDAWLNPARYRISGATVALPYAEYAQRAASAVGQGARALNIRLPDGEAKPVVVFARPRGEAAVIRRVYLDPATGRVLDAPAGRGLIAWAHDIHGSLLLREYNGRDIVGFVGVAVLISSLSGIYLWWPRRRFGARDFGFRNGFTRSRNLHYTFGFYSSLVLAMLAFTGIAISFPEAARSAVAVFGKLSESPRNVQATPAAGGKSISMDRAADVARALSERDRDRGWRAQRAARNLPRRAAQSRRRWAASGHASADRPDFWGCVAQRRSRGTDARRRLPRVSAAAARRRDPRRNRSLGDLRRGFPAGTVCGHRLDDLAARAPRAPAYHRDSGLDPTARGGRMNTHTYKLIELVGSSANSTDEAIRNAIAKASATIKHMDWFQVTETRGHIVDGKVAHFQVTLKVGFRIEG